MTFDLYQIIRIVLQLYQHKQHNNVETSNIIEHNLQIFGILFIETRTYVRYNINKEVLKESNPYL